MLPPISELNNGITFYVENLTYSVHYLFNLDNRPDGLKIDYDVYLNKLNKNLQREFCWTLKQQQELIISMLYKRPIPSIAIASTLYTEMVIDGKQRLISIRNYITNKFSIALFGVSYYYKDLPFTYQRYLQRYTLNAYYYDMDKFIGARIYNKDDWRNKEQDLINWYNYLNFAGTPHNQADKHETTH